MAIHFVSTSILSSTDGVDFSTEVSIDTEEGKRARADAAKGDNSLYDQLEERKKAKDEEYETNGKLMRGTKGMDEEDLEFFEDLAEKEAKARASTQHQENEALQQFREAQSNTSASKCRVY